ncbi:uncharacterized protein [Amphiura filiformis]|uniref:uncharacterized protein isoform X3 n=1 Tax=Amphiura filiformis TaxID=82378 RepID=UPI003B219358
MPEYLKVFSQLCDVIGRHHISEHLHSNRLFDPGLTIMSRGQTWGEDEVLSLIEIFWGENIQSMVDNTSRNRDVYKIVTDLMERRGHCRNAYEIRTKVNNLKQWYKRINKPGSSQRNERHKRTRIFKCMQERLTDEVEELEEEMNQEEMEEADVGEGDKSNDGSVDLPSNIDTDQSTASPSTARQDTEDNSETSRSAVDLTQQTSDSRKRKRTTPDRLIIDSSVDTSHKDDNLGTNSSGSEPTDDPEYYPKGVVVVQPTAVEDELESAPLAIREEPVVSRNEAAPTSNQRVLFAINRNPKKTPIPILPKITAVHSGYIPTAVNVAHVSQPRHSSTPYDRPQNRQRHTRAPPPPPPPPQQSGGFDPTVLQEQQQQEEHEAKMELFRLQIELATAQLRMAEDEHRIRFAKLQVELQTAQMEHDAKAAQLSTASSS